MYTNRTPCTATLDQKRSMNRAVLLRAVRYVMNERTAVILILIIGLIIGAMFAQTI